MTYYGVVGFTWILDAYEPWLIVDESFELTLILLTSMFLMEILLSILALSKLQLAMDSFALFLFKDYPQR